MGRHKKPVRTANVGKRAVMYIRVSTAEQMKGYGPDVQASICREYIERKGYRLVETFQDLGISGTKAVDDRDELPKALALCAKGDADVLVCYAQDRLARKGSVLDVILAIATRAGFRIETVREGYDLTAHESELRVETNSFIARLEWLLITERLRNGRIERSKRDGLGSGPLPFGYVRLPDGGIGVDENAAATVRRLFALRRKRTYQATAEQLNQENLAAPQGGEWNAGQVQRIEKNVHLYRTGERTWKDITAAMRWPVILHDRKGK